MTNVRFYSLKKANLGSSIVEVCELIESLYLQQHKVLILCDNEDFANALDDALWEFKEESFIPHNLQGEGPTPLPPVHIIYSEYPSENFSHLINLSQKLVENPRRFREICQFVTEDEPQKTLMREHYRSYQQQNLNVAFEPMPNTTEMA